MIVELFGPPAAGKTTLARALAARLKERGRRTDLWLSYRPGEESPPDVIGGCLVGGLNALRRISRPALELLSGTSVQAPRADPLHKSTEQLITLLPTRGFIPSLRLRQYLIRLASAWERAAASDAVVIFDQAYAQLVYSLILMHKPPIPEEAAAVIDELPRSHLVLIVEAPLDLIQARLSARQRAIGLLGRLLEAEQGPLSEQARLAEKVQKLLQANGRKFIKIGTGEENALAGGLERAEREILALLTPQNETAHSADALPSPEPC